MKIEYILKVVLDTLNDKKAEDIKIFDVKHLTSLCDFIAVASSSNSTHVKSLTDHLQDVLHENNIYIKNIEKDENFNWIILDCIDLVIHIFTTKTREFYNLEKIWGDAKEISCE